MKITGRMLAGYGESVAVMEFEKEFPDGCEPTPDCMKALVVKGIDIVGFCKDLFDELESVADEDAPPEVVTAHPLFDVAHFAATKARLNAQYAKLQTEELSIGSTYTDNRDDLRKAWKSGTMDRKTYLEECGAVRAVFVAQLKAFREKAELRSYEIMSEFLCGLPE